MEAKNILSSATKYVNKSDEQFAELSKRKHPLSKFPDQKNVQFKIKRQFTLRWNSEMNSLKQQALDGPMVRKVH